MISKTNLETLMSSLGYSYQRLAEESGIKFPTLRKYIDGQTKYVPTEAIVAIADALGCSTDFVLGRIDCTSASDEITFRNSLEKALIDKEMAGENICGLVRRTNPDRGSSVLPPVAPWPYDLLEDIFCTGKRGEYQSGLEETSFTIPITKDQEAGLHAAIDTLTDREKDVILLYYREFLTFEAIGDKYGITRSGVKQVQNKAIRKLRYKSNIDLITKGFRQAAIDEKTKQLCGKWKHLEEVENDVYDRQQTIDKKARALGMDPDIGDLRHFSINDMNLSGRSRNALSRTGIGTAYDLLLYIAEHRDTWKDIKGLGYIGQREISLIADRLAGFSFVEMMESNGG